MHIADITSPHYVPSMATFHNNIETSYKSKKLSFNHFNNWKDPSPSPLSPCTPSVSPLHILEPHPVPQQCYFDSWQSFELISIINTTTEALQSIVQFSERLVQQTNALHKEFGVEVKVCVRTHLCKGALCCFLFFPIYSCSFMSTLKPFPEF
jgi:hypothetical protein